MNPGDRVEILRGHYKGRIGTLVQWTVVQLDGFKLVIDPWDIALAEEEEVSTPNETNTAAAGNL